MLVDLRARRIVEHRHVEPGGPQASAIHTPPPPEDVQSDALARRQAVAAGEEAGRDIDHLVEIALSITP